MPEQHLAEWSSPAEERPGYQKGSTVAPSSQLCTLRELPVDAKTSIVQKMLYRCGLKLYIKIKVQCALTDNGMQRFLLDIFFSSIKVGKRMSKIPI
ncbi:hypothetical protein E5288_WYG014292 [Bos mutus]|uniref:Uncharacterized protein n=1 Tax=Bos mutus TaxID=72004 RepID=A0A6B0R5P5_9CETA|nr:hypothetical protein [Bos mutus]